MKAPEVPTTTYRLQLGPDLDLPAAAELVDGLANLGVSHLYCSPFLQAAPEATHGYAVVDPTRVDERLGGEEGRKRLRDATARHGMGLVLDVVPNHMSTSLPSNRWFWDVLEHGRASRWAGHFDVDWAPPDAPARNRVLLPLLADHYGRELEAGTLRLEHESGRFRVRYHDRVLPVSPRSVAVVVGRAARATGSDELGFVSRALASLPPASAADESSRRRRQLDAGVLGRMLCRAAADPRTAEALDAAVREINDDPDELDRLLDRQSYRLARWRAASQELGYRRFFDIDTLIGLRVEDPEVFEDVHELVIGWIRSGELSGLRIDHPDGLRDPGTYLRRLRASAPETWIVVEKILQGDEHLPCAWPVDGTTGYEFIEDVTHLLIDPEAEAELTRLWIDISGSAASWKEVAVRSRRDVLHNVLAADLNRLAAIFLELCRERRRLRDFTRQELTDALAEALVGFDVYRTYVGEDGSARAEDSARIEAALERARSSAQELDPELFDLLEVVLEASLEGPSERELRMRFQQLTGPIMAKGVEDTAFYRFLRLVPLCEVGGDPGRFGCRDASAFHARCMARAERWPNTMLALTTHDTKRSEDVRARLAVLSEVAERWSPTVTRWRTQNEPHRPSLVDGATEYLLYQTLVGAHPIGADRLLPYMEKATKEAKTHTSWIDPEPDYDRAVADFTRWLCEDDGFQSQLELFVQSIRHAGRVNSLVQKTLQLTVPGVPDIYQGTELWSLTLVDPDNRRPVDHGHRLRLQAELGEEPNAARVLERMDEGLPKLWVVRELTRLRARRRETFAVGDHTPLRVSGPASAHVVAYARAGEVAVVVPRLTVRLEQRGGWRATSVTLPSGTWRHLFAGTRHAGVVECSSLLADFPVAVLERLDA